MTKRLTLAAAVLLILAVPAAAQQQPLQPRQPGYYVLDGFGGVHAGNGAPALYGVPYWGDDVFEELEIIEVRCDGEPPRPTFVRAIALDSLGGIWEMSSGQHPNDWLLWTAVVPYKPYMMARTRATGDETPFFGFDVARDVEVLVNPLTVWHRSCSPID